MADARIQVRHGTASEFEASKSTIFPDEVVIVDSGLDSNSGSGLFYNSNSSDEPIQVANSEDVYTQDEVDDLLAEKADKAKSVTSTVPLDQGTGFWKTDTIGFKTAQSQASGTKEAYTTEYINAKFAPLTAVPKLQAISADANSHYYIDKCVRNDTIYTGRIENWSCVMICSGTTSRRTQFALHPTMGIICRTGTSVSPYTTVTWESSWRTIAGIN